MLCLEVHAPFAVFRTFSAGSFRPTAGFMTPSAAYGLLLNLAGIEMRDIVKEDIMTHIASGLPQFSIALGALAPPNEHSVYQQLHNYPVGNSGNEHKPATMENKYNITPVRRAFLSNLKACIAVQGGDSVLQQIAEGLQGHGPQRYGLPFLGDNNFLPDRIEMRDAPLPARWYSRLDATEADELDELPQGVTRLTISIDRSDHSRTTSALFAPSPQPTQTIPAKAWVDVGH